LRRRLGELITATADQVAEGMASKRVAAQQNNVEEQDEGADAEAEVPVALVVLESAGLDEVPEQERDEDERDVEEIAVERSAVSAAGCFSPQ